MRRRRTSTTKKERRGKASEKNEEKKKKRETGAQRAKPPTPTRGGDALIGDEEQYKTEGKNGAYPQPSYRVPFGRLLRPA